MGTLELSNLIQLEINENLRNISIPKKGVVFGVDGDIEVNRVAFVFPRYYSNFDMTEFSARVNYVNANGEANYYEADDMSSDDGDTATFSWLMTSDVTSYIGEVRFSVLLYKQLDERYVKKFGTRPATGRVLEGLDVESYVTPEQQLTLIEKMEKKFDAYVEAKILGVNHDIEDAKNGALDAIEEAKNDVDSFIASSKSEIDSLLSSSLDDIKNLTDTSKLNISTLTDEKLASLDKETVRQLKNIELAGVEETEKIRTAFSSTVSYIQTEGQKQADAVDSHGDSKIKEINDSTATSLANINSISEKQVEAIQLEGTKQTSSVSSEGNKQVSTVASAGATEVTKVKSASSTVLSNIDSAKEYSISEITAKGTEQVKIIKDTSTSEISKVQAAGTSQVKSVSDEGKIQIDGVKSEGEKQVQLVSAKGTQSLQDIDTAKTAAVKSVNDQTKPIIDKVEQLKQNVNDKSDSVDEAYEQMKKLHCIEISEEAPTNERTGLWVNPKSNEEINIPEIKDEEVSGIDTWSSQKINHEIDSLKEDIDNMEHIISANNIKNAPVVSKLVDESYAHESNFVIINGMCYMHYMYNTWDKWSDMNIHPETQGYIGVRLSVFSIAEPNNRTVYNIVRGGDDFLGETVGTDFCGSGTITKIGTIVRILTNITLSNSGRTCVFFDFDSNTNSVTKKGICNVRIKGTDDFVPMTIQNGKQHAKWLYDNGYIDTEYESLFNEFGSDIREYFDNGTKYVTTAMAKGTNVRSCVLLTSENCINWTALGILDTQTASGIRLNVMEAGVFRYGPQFYLIGRNNVNIATDSKDVPYFWKIEDSNLYKSTKPVCLDGDVDCSGAKPSVIRLISRNNLFLLANISAYDKNEFSLVSGIGRVAIEFYKLNFDKDTMKAKRILRVSMIEGIHTPCLYEYERNVYMSYTSQKRLLHFMDGDIRFCKLDEELFH